MNSNRRYSECGSRPRSASVCSRYSRRAGSRGVDGLSIEANFASIDAFPAPPSRSKIRRARDCARNVRPSRAANHCPHPRAQGALALSLDRERDLERQGEGKRSTQTLVSARWPTTISSIPEVPQWQYQKFLNGTPEVPSRRVVSSSAAQFL